jgi:hypothetical protein
MSSRPLAAVPVIGMPLALMAVDEGGMSVSCRFDYTRQSPQKQELAG